MSQVSRSEGERMLADWVWVAWVLRLEVEVPMFMVRRRRSRSMVAHC